MIYKVHWIVDGVAEIEVIQKRILKKLQESLEEYVKSSQPLMDKFYAKSIQGARYLPGSKDERKIIMKTKKISLLLIIIFLIPEIAISVGRKYEPEEGTFDEEKE